MSIGNTKGIRRPKFVWEKTRTKQSFKDETDINKIVARYIKTGVLDFVKQNPGVYSDLSKVKDLKQSLETVMHAQVTFDSLPANIRNRFNNDPAYLVDFMSDKKNTKEAIALGLLPPEKIDDDPPTAGKKKPTASVPTDDEPKPKAKGKNATAE